MNLRTLKTAYRRAGVVADTLAASAMMYWLALTLTRVAQATM
jgi:hypothetical protein